MLLNSLKVDLKLQNNVYSNGNLKPSKSTIFLLSIEEQITISDPWINPLVVVHPKTYFWSPKTNETNLVEFKNLNESGN